MEHIQTLLARNVRRIRELAGWTREEFSEKIGISANYLSEIEAGKKFPRPQILDTLCDVSGVRPTDLFGDVDEQRKSFSLQAFAGELRENFPEFLAAILKKSKD
jgi:transcriptional regulator with XRE-family HTH domain